MLENFEQIIADLKDANPDKREAALDRLVTMYPDKAFPYLLSLKDDQEQEVRAAVACNLRYVGGLDSLKYLIRMVDNDSSEMVRGEALSSLAKYNTPEALHCLLREAHREKKSRRPHQEVAKQLRYYDTDESVDALVKLLKDEDVDVRDFAAESLYQLNRPSIINAWEKSLNDQSPDVRKYARKALAKLKRRASQ